MHDDLGMIALRLGAALLIGAVIGIERHLHGQAAGLRTHAVVATAAALAVLVVEPLSPSGSVSTDAQSRVLQGILTGVGFLGAGVILHAAGKHRIHGLTSAALIWLTAVLGALCGHGRIDVALVGTAMIVIVMLLGGRVEHALHAKVGRGHGGDADAESAEEERAD
ncbi:MgtC/SapB family protein [Rudaea sp.]|uniref:MgtC/SapB family protein n=1 Tax=Rudaea sp. TaxID=2136325 RepID=UPI002ED0B230